MKFRHAFIFIPCLMGALLLSALGSDRANAVTFDPIPVGTTINFDFGNVTVGTSLTVPFSFTFTNGPGEDYVTGAILASFDLNIFGIPMTGDRLSGICLNAVPCNWSFTFSPIATGLVENTLNLFIIINSLSGNTALPDIQLSLHLQGVGVQAVPLPAALPLFAGGLGALGLIGWRRKKKVALAA